MREDGEAHGPGAANGGSSKRTNEVRAGDVSARRRVTEPNEERGWEAST